MIAPVLMVPPTPRPIPGTPRGSRASQRSRSPALSRARLQPLPTVLEEVLGDTQIPSGLHRDALQALPPRAEGSSGSAPQIPSGLPRDTLQALPPRADHDASATSSRRRSSQATGLTADLEAILEDQYPELRGTKRTATSGPEELQLQPTRTSRAPPMTTSTTTAVPLETPDIPEQVLLTFCLRCGEQHRVVNDGVNQCSRCNATETDNSALVESWFDEVKE